MRGTRPRNGQIDPPYADDAIDLGALLDMDDLRRQAAAIADAITADFANRMQDAKRRVPRHEVAATLHALQQARRAALAAASQKAAMEIQGRRRAARDARPRRRRGVRGFVR